MDDINGENFKQLMQQVSEHTAEIIIKVIAKSFDLSIKDIRDAIQKELSKPNKSPKVPPEAKITK